jgi:hypothetical protein
VAQSYFYHPGLVPQQIRMRAPKQQCDPVGVFRSFSKKLYQNLARPQIDAQRIVLHKMASDLRAKRWSSIIQSSKSHDCHSLIPLVYTILAAMCADDSRAVLESMSVLSRTICPLADLSHFYHLIDEIMVYGGDRQFHGLLRLLLGRECYRTRRFELQCQATPWLNTFYSSRPLPQAIRLRKHVFEEGVWIRNRASENMPVMRPVVEGFSSVVVADEERGIQRLMEDREYELTVSKCTQILQSQPNRADILLTRAFALFFWGKETDALADAENVIRIDPLPVATGLKSAILAKLRIVLIERRRDLVSGLGNRQRSEDGKKVAESELKRHYGKKLLAMLGQ